MVEEKVLFELGLWDAKNTDINLSYHLDDAVYAHELDVYLMSNPKDMESDVSVIGKYGSDVVVYYRFPHKHYAAAASLFKFIVNTSANPRDIYQFNVTLPESLMMKAIVEGGRVVPSVEDITRSILERKQKKAVEGTKVKETDGWTVPCRSCRTCQHPMKADCVFYRGE